MASPGECRRCGGRMARGFIVDNGHGTRTVAAWVEGEPETSIWTGIKLKGRKPVDIATFRCARCGFLESYAGS